MREKNLTKYVIALVAVLLCVLCVPTNAMAASDSCGENSTWNYDNGTLTISGTGEIKDSPWLPSYKDSITTVVIEEGITSINKLEAFANCSNLKQVTLPNSLKDLGWFTFKNCTALESITIPKNVVKCGGGGNCFAGSGLKSATIENGATVIPCQMFTNCKMLQTVEIPQTVTTIEGFAFENCTSLEEITLPKSLKDMGWYTFKGCTSLDSIIIPKNVVKCGSGGHCFENTGLTTATIENGATIIPGGLFANCKTLQTVNLPQSITKIGGYAFENCTGLTEIVLPWYLEAIPNYTFKGCTNLKEITIYQKVARIDSQAFQKVTNLKIYGKAKSTAQTFAQKNGYPFAACKIPALKGITYTKGNLKYTVISDYANNKGTVCVKGMVKNTASVTIPQTVKLESYNYKVVKINSNAFYQMNQVKKITIQATSITSIGKNAFKGIYKNAIFRVPKASYSAYTKLLTSNTGFIKNKMKIEKY